MGVSFLVSDIQERVRVRCGLPAYTANTNVTTAMILSMVQESARDLSAIVNESDWYFATKTNPTTAANVATVALPANFGKLLSLSWVKSSNQVLKLDPANLEEVRPGVAGATWETRIPEYRLAADAIEFFPTPTAVYNLELRYTTGMVVASAGDTLVGQNGWDTWIVYNCCCIVRERQEKEHSDFERARDKKLVEIQLSAKRDPNGIKQPRDVRSGPAYDPTDPWWRF